MFQLHPPAVVDPWGIEVPDWGDLPVAIELVLSASDFQDGGLKFLSDIPEHLDPLLALLRKAGIPAVEQKLTHHQASDMFSIKITHSYRVGASQGKILFSVVPESNIVLARWTAQGVSWPS